MKVIIIKECKTGKVNEVKEVKDGFAKNFLIKNGYALPYNNKTNAVLKTNLVALEKDETARRDNALKVKKAIEGLKLSFTLKETNNKIHGSITKKQIILKLKSNKITINSHAIENIHIKSIGITTILVKLYKDINASLKVEVLSGK